MKKFIIATLMIAGFGLSQNTNAQVQININIGSQPAWGPVGYDYARYYYLPEANAYYDINAARFIYLNGRNWVYATSLPRSYGNINLYSTYKVVVNRNYAPYRDNRKDVLAYGKYRSVHNQVVIRDSRDSKYYESRYHPKHKEWVKNTHREKNSKTYARNSSSNRNRR